MTFSARTPTTSWTSGEVRRTSPLQDLMSSAGRYDMYLNARDPLPIYFNPFIMFKDTPLKYAPDPLPPKIVTSSGTSTTALICCISSSPFPTLSKDWVASASSYAAATANFYTLVRVLYIQPSHPIVVVNNSADQGPRPHPHSRHVRGIPFGHEPVRHRPFLQCKPVTLFAGTPGSSLPPACPPLGLTPFKYPLPTPATSSSSAAAASTKCTCLTPVAGRCRCLRSTAK